ncbi:hypothetical protein [Streptomyces sp. NPDC001536]|uniref:hypothetical protein n=1 Tax=Streptomyces sp. NPDC001536 TaxID=3364583 RepID=UPI00369251E2
MWPGERPPGDGTDPQQDANPYRQPGYQQPNPYTAQPAPAGPNRRTRTVALAATAAVVVAALVTGAVLLGGGSDDAAAPDPTRSSASPSASGNPRTADGQKPTVAGWKVVVNSGLGVAFDVPADWALESRDWVSYVAEDDDPDETPLVAMKGPAVLKARWCTSDDDKDGQSDDTPLASVGSRGNNGARSTEEIARADSAAWVYGMYTQPDKKKVTTTAAASFTTASGLTGSVATSTSSGVERQDKCDTDGRATTFAFKNAEGDFASWSFFGAAGVDEEVPQATVEEILSTVRVFTPEES